MSSHTSKRTNEKPIVMDAKTRSRFLRESCTVPLLAYFKPQTLYQDSYWYDPLGQAHPLSEMSIDDIAITWGLLEDSAEVLLLAQQIFDAAARAADREQENGGAASNASSAIEWLLETPLAKALLNEADRLMGHEDSSD